jgi:hypothetical protein
MRRSAKGDLSMAKEELARGWDSRIHICLVSGLLPRPTWSTAG